MKNQEHKVWTGWICHSCATKLGYVYPEGHVSSCVFGKCSRCGQERSLAPETDYYKETVHGKQEEKR